MNAARASSQTTPTAVKDRGTPPAINADVPVKRGYGNYDENWWIQTKFSFHISDGFHYT